MPASVSGPGSIPPSLRASNDPNVSDFAIPVLTLAQQGNRELAYAAYQLNDPAAGGVDHDRNPYVLRGDEFVLGLQRASASFTSDPTQLEQLIAHFRPLPGAQSPGWKPVDWQINPKLNRAIGVDLTVRSPYRGVAEAGYLLNLLRDGQGQATLRLLLPSDGEGQSAPLEGLRLGVYDRHGQKVDCILGTEVTGPASQGELGHRFLELRLDVARIPEPAYLRYSLPFEVAPRKPELRTPVPMSAFEALDDPELTRQLQASASVQVDHPEIQAAASQIRRRALAQGPLTVQSLVHETLAYLDDTVRPRAASASAEGEHPGLDALAYLRTGVGSCTSNGHLFAALTRANGLPTRVTNGILRGMSQQMHWVNEYYLPGQGWVLVEPQGRDLHMPETMIARTGVVPPEVDVTTDLSSPRHYMTGFFGAQVGADGALLAAGEGDLYAGFHLPMKDGSASLMSGFASS